LEVDDFDAAINRLRATGCTFRLEPMETPVCHMAVVFDPDGNSLMIHRRKADLIGFKRSCEEQAESYDGQGQSGGDRTRSLYDFYLCAAVQPPVQSRLALMHGSIFIGDGELAMRDLAATASSIRTAGLAAMEVGCDGSNTYLIWSKQGVDKNL
jgi:hypothetical protein